MESLMYRSLFFAATVMAALAASEAAAEVALTGFFIAREACPALQSIRNGTNPGEVQTAPGKSYPMIAKNKPNASHYFIEIEGADPARRWVAVDCGEHVVSADGSSQPQAPSPGEERDSDATRAEYVLSVSWQPAFCETKRDKAECATQTPDRFDATHFTLHGLWPQPRRNAYCDVPPEMSLADKDGDWDRLPEPKLSDATRQRLARVMPGTQSNLERHEWIKHGTCFHADSADEYFSRAIALVDQLNASKAQGLFASNVGGEITGKAIRDAFDESFGEGAGDRVRVSCKRIRGRNLIVELTIGLAGEIGDEPSLANLIAGSAATDPGCLGGGVDTVGTR
jgi:ribonuclease T2